MNKINRNLTNEELAQALPVSVALGKKPMDPSSASLQGADLPSLLRNELLSEIFADTATRYPDRICITEGERQLTYDEVDAVATAIARGLRRRGIGAGDVVGLWLSRGADLLIAQIAITKTGAAWLPFDADAPAERIAVCLEDAEAKALLVGTAQATKTSGVVIPCDVLRPGELIDSTDENLIDARDSGCSPESPAYMIYTSGSTGVPKGIVITQSNICHYLRSANETYGLNETDVVFQGASVAFDLSMEEIWVPYLVGAALFVATPEIIGEAEKLPDVMEAAGITVLDTVPTLLAMMPRDVASLRIIILGGEACPPTVAAKWCRADRVIYNSYGPTEVTVVATIAEVRVDEPVTIGKPIANYTCYVVDDNLNLVSGGEEGELLIGGPGVARGYLKRDDLTVSKFIANPFSSTAQDPVLYRSGDAVVMDTNGDLLFRGRIDDQVKIRGFRVELGEIEARLVAMQGISHAAVVVRNDDGMDQLVAFLVSATEIDLKGLRNELRKVLPAYMVPARFETLDEVPRLPSGKVNRNELKKLELAAAPASQEAQEEPQNETEAKLLEAAKAVLPPQNIPFDADFFADLGGHSLLAAKFISQVRQTPSLAGITLQHVYKSPTLRQLGVILDERNRFSGGGNGGARDLSFEPPPFWKRFACGTAQAIALVPIFALVTIQWLGLFLASIWLLRADAPLWLEMITLLGVYAGLNIGVKLTIIGLKWLIIGRTKPGVYPLWGVYYFRLWLVQRLVQVTTMKFLQSSPLMRWYLRALGAKVGKDAMIGEIEVGAIDLLTIGDNVSVGLKNKLGNVEVIGNQVHVGPITIHDGALTGNCCVLSRDVVIGKDAQVMDLTALPAGTVIGEAEIWDGSPAKRTGDVNVAELPPIAEATTLRRVTHSAIYALSYVVVLMFGLLPIFPAFYVLYNLDDLISGVKDLDVSWSMLPLLSWPTALALVVVSMVPIIAVRWMLLPRVSTGTYSIHSNFYLRKWIMGLATEVTLETLSSLYATVYMGHWYRAMGAKIGKGTEVSTNLSGRYDLVDIGAGNFIGDETVFGDEELHRGWMTLHTVKTGDRVFFGNDSVVAGGSVIEDGALIGVKSKLPDGLHVKANETWFGSPSITIPSRQKIDDMPAHWTFEPPLWFKVFRYFFEAAHTSLPTAMFITMAFITADVIAMPIDEKHYGLALLYFLLAGVASTLACIAFTVGIKWVTMGVYKPIMKPMWSFWAMRTEMVAVMYGGLAGKASNEFLRGTPFLPWILRLHGCKIGKGVWMELTDVTEFDCVTVGDYCALNGFSCLQTHLYEDRIMKVGRVHLGKGVTVGWGATVLYDTKVGDYAQIAPLTVVMKGENIPAHSAWAGSPAQPTRPVVLKQEAPVEVTEAFLIAAE